MIGITRGCAARLRLLFGKRNENADIVLLCLSQRRTSARAKRCKRTSYVFNNALIGRNNVRSGYVKPGVSLVDELIADRCKESVREGCQP